MTGRRDPTRLDSRVATPEATRIEEMAADVSLSVRGSSSTSSAMINDRKPRKVRTCCSDRKSD
jgi:hypothetical protein